MRERLAAVLRAAGQLLIARRNTGEFTYRRKGEANVTASVDLEAHDFLIRALGDLLPNVAVLSEEDTQARSVGRPETYWLIDPLDGTASFVDGFSGFVTQAALISDSQLMLAAVYAPALNEMFLAEAGKGATKNGDPIKVSERPRDQWIFADNYPKPRGIAADLMHEWAIRNYLESGSIGLKICRVAEGQADIFVKDVCVRDWDLAAPQLVLQEAGGCLTDSAGQSFPYRGDFERDGLIASAKIETTFSVAAWIRKRQFQK